MRSACVILAMMMIIEVQAGETVIRKITGVVHVRQGVAEQWNTTVAGEPIALNATLKVGSGSSAVLDVEGKTIKVPAETIVDISDMRILSKEELMLKLAMENVRSSSYEWKSNEMNVTRTTVTHGADKSTRRTLTENNTQEGRLELNGTKVLFENAYYSTCALKTKDILRRYPRLAEEFDYRCQLARALESAGLPREALNEYKSISTMENLTAGQKEGLSQKVASLNQRGGISQ